MVDFERILHEKYLEGANVATRKRKAAGERMLDSPVLSVRIDEEVRRLKIEPEWVAGEKNAITLAKYPHMRVVLVAMRRGTSLHEHRVEGPLSLFVISGHLDIAVGHAKHHLEEKGLFTLRKIVRHDVHAAEDSIFLMTIMQP